ncbi:MAG: hydrolase [Gammaproteobacteria bacterium]
MSHFNPAWWLPNGHFQTIWASKVARHQDVSYRIENFDFSDGDETAVAWHPSHLSLDALREPDSNNAARNPTPIVVVLHGLEGSSDSNYARGIAHQLALLGWRVAILHFRGCHSGPNKLQRSYHSGDTNDLREFLAEIKSRAPHAPIFGVGYSMGGNVLLKYLGEEASESLIDVAVAVSVPFKLDQAADRLARGASRLYQHVLLTSLKQKLLAKFAHRQCPIDLSSVPSLKSIRAYDDIVTAPLHGFRSAEDYYRRSSSQQFLSSVSTPTLIIHAEDDPLVPATAIPSKKVLHDNTLLECSPQGGHVAFVSGSNPLNPDYWLDERIKKFLTSGQ